MCSAALGVSLVHQHRRFGAFALGLTVGGLFPKNNSRTEYDGMADDFMQPQESRGMSGPFGKFTEPVKTHLDEHTVNLLLRLAAAADKVPGEWIRDVLYIVIHGDTPAELAAKGMKALLRGEGPDAVRNRVRGDQS